MRKSKLICAFGLGFSSLSVLAAPPTAQSLVGALTGKPATAAQPNAVPDLPLPPAHLGSSLAVPGFGKAQQPESKSTTLPGLGDISESYSNPGQGNGNAQFAGQLNLDPQSKQTAISGSANNYVSSSGQLVSDNKLQTPGFGAASNPVNNTVNLPLDGTLNSAYHNNGQGKTFDSELKLTSPSPNK